MQIGNGRASPGEISQDILYLGYVLLVCGSPYWAPVIQVWPNKSLPDCLEKINASVFENPQDPIRLPGGLGLGDVNLVSVAAILAVLDSEVPHTTDELDGILPSLVGFVLLYGTTPYNVGFVTIY